MEWLVRCLIFRNINIHTVGEFVLSDRFCIMKKEAWQWFLFKALDKMAAHFVCLNVFSKSFLYLECIGGGRWFWEWGRRKRMSEIAAVTDLYRKFMYGLIVRSYKFCHVHIDLYASLIALLDGCCLGQMYIKGVRAQSARRISLIICKIDLFVNTVVRWDLDMMLHSNLSQAPQLASPLLMTL